MVLHGLPAWENRARSLADAGAARDWIGGGIVHRPMETANNAQIVCFRSFFGSLWRLLTNRFYWRPCEIVINCGGRFSLLLFLEKNGYRIDQIICVKIS